MEGCLEEVVAVQRSEAAGRAHTSPPHPLQPRRWAGQRVTAACNRWGN